MKRRSFIATLAALAASVAVAKGEDIPPPVESPNRNKLWEGCIGSWSPASGGRESAMYYNRVLTQKEIIILSVTSV